MKYPLHKAETGTFQELARASHVIFGQLNVLTIEPGCSRGDHYHKLLLEWFCCIHGSCTMELTNSDNSTRILELTEDEREFMLVTPYENHKVVNKGDKVCEVIIIASREYDPDNPDTYKRVKNETN